MKQSHSENVAIIALLVVIAYLAYSDPAAAGVAVARANAKVFKEAVEVIRDGAELLCSSQAYGRGKEGLVLTPNARNHVRRVVNLVATAGLTPNRNFQSKVFRDALERVLVTQLSRGTDCKVITTHVLQETLLPQTSPQSDTRRDNPG